MEPAAVLVAAFEVEIGEASGYSGSAAQQRQLARAGLEPDVEDVHFLAERRAAAIAHFGPGGTRASASWRVPGIGAFAREQFDDLAG